MFRRGKRQKLIDLLKELIDTIDSDEHEIYENGVKHVSTCNTRQVMDVLGKVDPDVKVTMLIDGEDYAISGISINDEQNLSIEMTPTTNTKKRLFGW